jgi:very-short-patch-repair endonuclease
MKCFSEKKGGDDIPPPLFYLHHFRSANHMEEERGKGGELLQDHLFFYFSTTTPVEMLHRPSNKWKVYFRIRDLAREMRKNATPAEEFFWEQVRNRKLFGLKWNRQFIIECTGAMNSVKYYVADFHCHELKLVVELDGHIHLKLTQEDLIRTEHLIENGFSVIRFENQTVLENWELVKETIREFMENSTITHPPSPSLL